MLYSIGYTKPALKSKLPLHPFTNLPPKLQSWFCKTNTIMHYYDFKKSIKVLDISYLVRIYSKFPLKSFYIYVLCTILKQQPYTTLKWEHSRQK